MLYPTPVSAEAFAAAVCNLVERSRWFAAIGFLAALALLVPFTAKAEEQRILVFAAASMKQAVDQAAAAFKAKTGTTVTASYAASSALARQIADGAPADIYISADLDWMDFLAGKNLIKPGTRVDLAGNTLVLITQADRKPPDLTIEPDFPLAAALADRRLALAEPNAVPAGRYAKAALQSLAVWDSVSGKLAPTENVMAALILVARGETPFGIVYGSDAAADKRVRAIGTFPQGTHAPIRYPAAVTVQSQSSRAADFLAFLSGPDGLAIFTSLGFTALK